jgi:hypothetical protein
VLLSALLHASVTLHNLLNVPVQFANKMGFQTKRIICAAEDRNEAAGLSEEKVRPWRNGHAYIVSCMATTKSFTGPKKGMRLTVDAAALHCIKEHMQWERLSRDRICKKTGGGGGGCKCQVTRNSNI